MEFWLLLQESFRNYSANLRVALAFALLLVFVLPFSQLETAFVSSGSAFAEYNLLAAHPLQLLLLTVLSALFLLFYSVLTTLVVFAVKRNLSKVKLGRYLSEGIQKFALKYAAFLFMFTAVVCCAASIALPLAAPSYAVAVAVFLISLPFIFLPQALVVEESSLRSSITACFEFTAKNARPLAYVVVLGFAFALFLPALEFVFDCLFAAGRFVALLFAMVFAVPFLEVFKTQLYMRKFNLVKRSLAIKKPAMEVEKRVVIKDISRAK